MKVKKKNVTTMGSQNDIDIFRVAPVLYYRKLRFLQLLYNKNLGCKGCTFYNFMKCGHNERINLFFLFQIKAVALGVLFTKEVPR